MSQISGNFTSKDLPSNDTAFGGHVKSTRPDRGFDPKAARAARSLSLDRLVNAGIEVGLEHLSIGSLAAKLGVRVSTIYTYVDGVDELRRLVTAGLSKTEQMKDNDPRPALG